MDEAKAVRTFLAIDPPEEILREIGRIQDRLRKAIQGTVHWVRPQGIHLTLKFFGEIPGGEIPAIKAVVEARVAQFHPVALRVAGVGAFPDPERPRVIWLGIGGDVQRLVRLQEDLEEGFSAIGFPKEARPFRPHLTLGRVKSPRGLIGLEKAIEKEGALATGSFHGQGLTLFRSDLTPQGALYTPLANFPFKIAS